VDPEARFEDLYRVYAARVYAYALRRGSAAMAEDVVAEVFLVAWRRLEVVPRGDAAGWLLQVARRVLANHRRGERRAGALLERLAGQLGRDSAGIDEGDERTLRALACLSERDQELVLLVAWEDLDPSQVAEVLGVRRGTVAVRLHRARRRFAAALVAEDSHRIDRVEVS
jgi:RNA polymerase sigma-70 factor, ECF subfamily